MGPVREVLSCSSVMMMGAERADVSTVWLLSLLTTMMAEMITLFTRSMGQGPASLSYHGLRREGGRER